jgi:hypothetical protein
MRAAGNRAVKAGSLSMIGSSPARRQAPSRSSGLPSRFHACWRGWPSAAIRVPQAAAVWAWTGWSAPRWSLRRKIPSRACPHGGRAGGWTRRRVSHKCRMRQCGRVAPPPRSCGPAYALRYLVVSEKRTESVRLSDGSHSRVFSRRGARQRIIARHLGERAWLTCVKAPALATAQRLLRRAPRA